MKILLLNQFFWPDSAATSQLLTDLARSLAEAGHDVSVICADGGYALSAADEPPPARIHRIRTLPFSRGIAGRILSYGSFYLAAAARGLTLPEQDLVVTLTTPPLLPLLGTLIKMVRGSRHFIWEMDVYPDVAIALDYFKADGIADRVVGLLADFSRRRADGVIALGVCMRERLIKRGIPAAQILVADNWADSRTIVPLPKTGSVDRLTVLYSGNLGLAHDVPTIAGAMYNLRADSRFNFVFAGGGARREELASFCATHHLSSVQFRPYVQQDSLSESLSVGDIGLVTQRDACCGSVVPSKVYGLLAAGRPVLFIGPRDATPARIIERFRCGWHVACGDTASLTALLRNLSERPDLVAEAGRAARQALLDYYDRPLGVERIAGILGARPVATTLLDHEGGHSEVEDRSSLVAGV